MFNLFDFKFIKNQSHNQWVKPDLVKDVIDIKKDGLVKKNLLHIQMSMDYCKQFNIQAYKLFGGNYTYYSPIIWRFSTEIIGIRI